MKIKKIYNGVVPNGKILNSKNTSQNDTYSCSYINDNLSNNYSTEEQVIGKWMGKPLYRKVIEVTNILLNQWHELSSGISNMSFAYIENAFVTFSGVSRPIMTAEPTINEMAVQIKTDGKVAYYVPSIVGNVEKVYIIVNYTKTTDKV